MSKPQTIPALHKAISVMEYVADRGEPVSVKELAYSLNIPPASCYRMVNTLLDHNWLREDPAGGLRIAFGMAHVARSYSALETRLRELEAPLRQLSSALSMSIKITLREGHYAVTALRAEPARPNAITSPIGYRFHLAIGSAAAVLLAQLSDSEIQRILDSAPDESWERQTTQDVWERIRACQKKGSCSDLGLSHPSIYAISIPLPLAETETVALTAVGWPEDLSKDRLTAVTKELKAAVNRFC